jgi:acyl carrier protein
MSKTLSRDQILAEIVRMMSERFEMDPEEIRPESRLFEDLDLDSIDAIDMAVKMQDLTGKRVEESSLRTLRTVKDVVDLTERLLQEAGA